MPFIEIKTANKLSAKQREGVKSGIGEIISMIPAKAEEKTMIAISDSMHIYFRGDEKESAAFVDVRLKDAAPFEDKAKFTEALFTVLEQQAGIAKDDTYVSISEFEEWGSRGALKK